MDIWCKLNVSNGIEVKFPERFVKKQYLDLDQSEEQKTKEAQFSSSKCRLIVACISALEPNLFYSLTTLLFVK